MMDNKIKKKLLYVVYAIIVCFVISSIVFLGHFSSFRDFLSRVEQSSFDIRQKTLIKYKKPSKDIVIIAIDDESYEYIMDKFGSWPISRSLWANTINALENANAKNVIIDMLFVKPTLDKAGDDMLVDAAKNNKNVFLAVNFDNVDPEVRKPAELDNKFKLKLLGDEPEANDYIAFSNVRTIMKPLAEATKNVGAINVTRDDDGVIRNITPVFKYNNDYYPNLSLLAAMNILNKDKIVFFG